jgi:hypothetical protein
MFRYRRWYHFGATRGKTQKGYWNDLEQVREYRVYTGRQITKTLETEKDALTSCVLPVLVYGAQTWPLAEKERRCCKLSSGRWNEESCKLCGPTDGLTEAQIRKCIQTKELVAVAHSLRWKGGDHVARMDRRRWRDSASVWDLRMGERRAGRPKTLWSDTFWRVAGGQWSWTDKNWREWSTPT